MTSPYSHATAVRIQRWGRGLALAAGLALLVWTLRRLGLSAAAAVSALAVLGLALWPPGVLLARMLPRDQLRPGERVVLAFLLGYPTFSALYWFAAGLGIRAFYPAFLLALAGVAAVVTWRDRHPSAGKDSAEHRGRPHWSLPVLVPLALLLALRGATPFVALGDGTLRYDHSMDHSIHQAFYWELLRDTPPAEIPALAGVPFPRYHLLGFMPGLLLADLAGLQVSTVYHLASPLLRLTLLMGALYLVVRVRTGHGRLATATIPAVILVSHALALWLDGRFLENTTPLYFFIRSESGGAGLVVWATVAALTSLHDRRQGTGRALDLAAILAGLAFSFKAQIFALLGVSFAVVLVDRALRTRSRAYPRALLLMGLVVLALLASWQASGHLGRIHFTPGALAQHYVYPVLAGDPSALVRERILGLLRDAPYGLGWMVATPLALWRMTAFSPLVLLFVLRSLGRFGSVGLTDGWNALAFPVALLWGSVASSRDLNGDLTPYETLQAAACLPLIAAVANVLVLAALARRWREAPAPPAPGHETHSLRTPRVDAAGVVLWSVLLASAMAWWAIVSRPPFVPARTGISIRPDEQCALVFLREATPFDAVVASNRTDSLPELQGTRKRFNHQAVVAGLAGRRSVLEYYGKDADPERNRQRALRRLFSTRDPGEARQILERFGVDYLIEYAGHPLRFPIEGWELAFARGGVRVYAGPARRHRAAPFRPAAAAWLPGFLRDPSDLACPEAAGSPAPPSGGRG
ncbi:MAG TPA: hypothetical protein VJU18_11480 [Vicinamibacteria bacterium]|nr:hypothetical protein [Vicinamibacteria bacterium]